MSQKLDNFLNAVSRLPGLGFLKRVKDDINRTKGDIQRSTDVVTDSVNQAKHVAEAGKDLGKKEN